MERIENGVRSSMQLFVEPKKMGGIDISIHSLIPGSTVSDEGITKIIVFDALIANTDRHGGNFLFSKEESQLVAIDHHSAFKSNGPI